MTEIITYDIDYLVNEEFTDQDLDNLLNTNSFDLSYIIYLFELIDMKLTKNEIIEICSKENWCDNYYISKRNYNKFIEKLMLGYKNLYYYDIAKCKSLAELWYIKYGIKIRYR